MSRILLADDSAHAQRMGEYILREEGYEVVSITDGETALLRLRDVDPDLVLADVLMPVKSGYQICEFVKTSPYHRHTRVVLTAGVNDPWNPEEAARVRADGKLVKPFEASAMIEMVKPLAAAAESDRGSAPASEAAGQVPGLPEPEPVKFTPFQQEERRGLDPERVRAAVALALDEAMSDIIEKITEKVLVALDRNA
ncbi:MAG: response regulator [Acidobacteria bacterium]|nr:response regulator [Acidobacteriota bacterium]